MILQVNPLKPNSYPLSLLCFGNSHPPRLAKLKSVCVGGPVKHGTHAEARAERLSIKRRARNCLDRA